MKFFLGILVFLLLVVLIDKANGFIRITDNNIVVNEESLASDIDDIFYYSDVSEEDMEKMKEEHLMEVLHGIRDNQ